MEVTSRGAVSVDVGDIARREPGVLECQLHAADRAGTARSRRGDVVSVRGRRAAEQLRVDVRPPSPRALELLEHENGPTLGDDKAVPAHVERPRLPARRQCRHVAEGGERDGGHCGLGTAGEHRVTASGGDQAVAGEYRVRARRARGGDCLARPSPTEAHRNRRAAGIRHHHRHEKRGYPPRALFEQYADLGLHGAETPDAGADLNTGERWIDVELAGILERHLGGSNGKLGEEVYTSRFFGIEPERGVEVPDPVLTLGSRTVETRKEGILADPATRHHAESRDRDPAATPSVGPELGVGHQSFEVTSS
jgi:hypothetical protein